MLRKFDPKQFSSNQQAETEHRLSHVLSARSWGAVHLSISPPKMGMPAEHSYSHQLVSVENS